MRLHGGSTPKNRRPYPPFWKWSHQDELPPFEVFRKNLILRVILDISFNWGCQKHTDWKTLIKTPIVYTMRVSIRFFQSALYPPHDNSCVLRVWGREGQNSEKNGYVVLKPLTYLVIPKVGKASPPDSGIGSTLFRKLLHTPSHYFHVTKMALPEKLSMCLLMMKSKKRYKMHWETYQNLYRSFFVLASV